MAAEHDNLFKKLFQINEAEDKLNLDKIRQHIIRCIVELNDIYNVDEHETMKQCVFANAVQLLVKKDEAEEADVNLLIDAIRYEKKDTYDWYHLHWAVALKDRIKEDDVHALFLASPTSLIQHLDEEGNDCPGFTPVDLLVMQKNPKMSLVRYFDLQSPKVFTSSRMIQSVDGGCNDMFPLHLAAKYSENLELMQYLLQTYFAAATYNGEGNKGEYPLSLLLQRDEFPTFDSMLQCLLDASSDSNVIGCAIRRVLLYFGCNSDNTGRILKLVEILLNVNPSAAKYVDEADAALFHAVNHLEDPICAVGVLKLLLVHYPLGLEVTDIGSNVLPIHSSLEFSSVEVVKHMLQVHPSSIESTAVPGLMHSAVWNTVDAGMVPYLCSIAPQLLHDQDNHGMTPLATLCNAGEQEQGLYAKMLVMCETDATIVRKEMTVELRLPLHSLLYDDDKRWGSPTSDFADCFRLLLRLHPSAAEALDSDGDSPISYAIEAGMDDYFIRLLLAASTDAEHKALLSGYNHKHRRNLLWLSFSALSQSPQPTIFARLRQSHRESLKVVASFL